MLTLSQIKAASRQLTWLTGLSLSTLNAFASEHNPQSLDQKLRRKLNHHDITQVTPPPPQSPALVALGRNLFF